MTDRTRYLSELRALEASLVEKLTSRDWSNCKDSLRAELVAVRAEKREVSFWTDTSAQENS